MIEHTSPVKAEATNKTGLYSLNVNGSSEHEFTTQGSRRNDEVSLVSIAPLRISSLATFRAKKF
jgi:hypothetical protein